MSDPNRVSSDAAVVAQDGILAERSQDFDGAVKLYDEGIRLKAPGDVLNFWLFNSRSGCQWVRYHCAHAVIDAATAAQLNGGLWQPHFHSGMAWQMMGLHSFAVKVRSCVPGKQMLTMLMTCCIQVAAHSEIL